jgi:hypothetical protein
VAEKPNSAFERLVANASASTPTSGGRSSGSPHLDFFRKRFAQLGDGGIRGGLTVGAGYGDMSPELAEAAQAYKKARSLADTVGLGAPEDDDLGFLEGLFKVIDTPRAFAFGLGKEAADLIGGGGEASLDDLWEQAWTKQEGFGDTEVLKWDDDDAWWMKALKGTGALVGDIATDPLTYATLGVGSGASAAVKGATKGATTALGGLSDDVGRKIAGELAQTGAKGAVKSSDDAAEALMRNIADDAFNKTDDVLSKADDPFGLADEVADDVAEKAGTPKLFGQDEEAVRTGLEARMRRSFEQGGATGMRNELRSIFGDEVGDQVFGNLHSSIRGGLTVRNPLGFAFRDADGLAKPLLHTGADTKLGALLGNSAPIQAAKNAKFAAKASKPGQALTRTFGGELGSTVARARGITRATGLLDEGFEAADRAWNDVVGIERGRAAHVAKMSKVGEDYAESFSQAEAELAVEGVDSVAAKRYMTDFLEDAERFAAGPVNASDIQEVAGYKAAQEMRGFLSRWGEELELSGALRNGQLKGYMPRQITDAEKARMVRQGRKVGDSSAARGRNDQWINGVSVDENGKEVIDWMSPRQITEVEGREVFITDPMVAMSRYVSSSQRQLSAHVLSRELQRRGVAFSAEELYEEVRRVTHQGFTATAKRIAKEVGDAVEMRQDGANAMDDLAKHADTAVQRLDAEIGDLGDSIKRLRTDAANRTVTGVQRRGVKTLEAAEAESLAKVQRTLAARDATVAALTDTEEALPRLRNEAAAAVEEFEAARRAHSVAKDADSAARVEKAKWKREEANQRITAADERAAFLRRDAERLEANIDAQRGRIEGKISREEEAELRLALLTAERADLADFVATTTRQADGARAAAEKVRGGAKAKGDKTLLRLAKQFDREATTLDRQLEKATDRLTKLDTTSVPAATTNAGERQRLVDAALAKSNDIEDALEARRREATDIAADLPRLRKAAADADAAVTKANAAMPTGGAKARKAALDAERKATVAHDQVAKATKSLGKLRGRIEKLEVDLQRKQKTLAQRTAAAEAGRTAVAASRQGIEGLTEISAARLKNLKEARRLMAKRADKARELSGIMQEEMRLLATTRDGIATLVDPANWPKTAAERDQYLASLIDMVGQARAVQGAKADRLKTINEALLGADAKAMTAEQRKALRGLRDRIQRERRPMADSKITAKATEGRTQRSEMGQTLFDDGFAEIRSSGDVKIPERAFEDVWGSEAVRDYLGRIYEVKSGDVTGFKAFLQNVYEPYMALFRNWATRGRGPGFSLRNYYGTLWQNYAGGVSWQTMRTGHAYTHMFKKAESYALDEIANRYGKNVGRKRLREFNELVDGYMKENATKQVSGDMTLYDFHRMMEDNNVFAYNRQFDAVSRRAADDDITELAAIARGDGRQILWDKPTSEMNRLQRTADASVNARPMQAWLRFNGKTNDLVERSARAASFIHGYKTYGDVSAAKMFTVKLHFDYSDLSKTEREVFRNALPFYTWMRKNIPLQAFFLMHSPGKVANLMRVVNSVEDTFGDEGELGVVPSWLRRGMAVPLAGGNFAAGVDLPLNDLNKMFNAPTKDNALQPWGLVNFEELLRGVNPLAKAGIEAYTGESTFTNQPYKGAVETPWWLGGGALNPVLDMLPGVETGVTEDGKAGISEQALVTLKNLLPPVGQIDRLIPSTDAGSEKAVGAWASNLLGVTATPITEKQKISTMLEYEDNVQAALNTWLAERGVAKDWWTGMRQRGYTPRQLVNLIDQGSGRMAG